MTKNEALNMAIEALAKCKEAYLAGPNWQKVGYDILDKSQQACKEALERPTNMVAVPADQLEKMQKELKQLRKQPAQEPVAWIYEWEDEKAAKLTFHPDSKAKVIPLYTHPTPSWQGMQLASDVDIAKSIMEKNKC